MENKIKKNILSPFQDMPNLKNLNLSRNKIQDVNINVFKNTP